MTEPQFYKLDEQRQWTPIGDNNALSEECKAEQIRPDTILRREVAKTKFEIKPAGRMVRWACATKEERQPKTHFDFDEVRKMQKDGVSNFRWVNRLYVGVELEKIVQAVEEADKQAQELLDEPGSPSGVVTAGESAVPAMAAPSVMPPRVRGQTTYQDGQLEPAATAEPQRSPNEGVAATITQPQPPAPSSAGWLAPSDTSASSAPIPKHFSNLSVEDVEKFASELPPGHKASNEKKPSRIAFWTLIAAVMPLLIAIIGSQCWWYWFGFQNQLDETLGKLNVTAQTVPPPVSANSQANGPPPSKTANDTVKKEDLAALKSQVDKSTASLKPQIDELATALKSQIAQSVTSLSAALGDDSKQRRGQLAQALKDLQSLTESLQKINGDGKQRWEQTAKDLKDVQSQIAEFRRDARLAQGHLERLSASVQVPPDDRLTPVLVMIDSGERMREYDNPAVRQAVLQTVAASLRQTPRRKIGVAANRGDRITVLLAPDVHFLVPDLEVFRKELADHQAAVGEESIRLVGVQSALDLVVPRGGKWRLVYVTCTPLRHADPEPEKWRRAAELSRKYAVEVWAIHLLKTGEEPSLDLLNLATDTGGQYVGLCVRGADATTDRSNSSAKTKETIPRGTAESVQQRLSQLLCQPLDLPPIPRIEP